MTKIRMLNKEELKATSWNGFHDGAQTAAAGGALLNVWLAVASMLNVFWSGLPLWEGLVSMVICLLFAVTYLFIFLWIKERGCKASSKHDAYRYPIIADSMFHPEAQTRRIGGAIVYGGGFTLSGLIGAFAVVTIGARAVLLTVDRLDLTLLALLAAATMTVVYLFIWRTSIRCDKVPRKSIFRKRKETTTH